MATPEEMDQAAPAALAEFDAIYGQLTGDQRRGAQYIIEWLRKYYRKVGYKRLLSRGIFKKEL